MADDTLESVPISRRRFLQSAAAATALGAAAGRGDESARRPVNLLFINADQLRFDALGCAGNPFIETPNLDRLAAEGARFTHAVTPLPMCTPARTSYRTGLSVRAHGCLGAPNSAGKNLRLGSGNFDRVLAEAGYHCEFHGRYHAADSPDMVDCYANRVTLDFIGPYKRRLADVLGPPPAPKAGQFIDYLSGWPYVPDPPDYELRKFLGNLPGNECPGVEYGVSTLPAEHTLTAFTAREAMDAIDRMGDRPFSLSVAFLHPHHPQYVAEPWAGSVDPKDMTPPATVDDTRKNTPYAGFRWQVDATEKQHIRLIQARYYQLVRELDREIGRILDRLDERGLADETLVIFTSDHGEMLGDHGLTQKFVPYQESIRVPLLARLPGRIPIRTVVDHPVNTIDIHPTVFDYLGLPIPASQGHSLRPLVEGTSRGRSEHTFSEFGQNWYVLLVSRDWKLVWTPDPRAVDMLYNLQDDPRETTNLLGANPQRAKHLPRAEAMRKAMLEWMATVDHPLRDRLAKAVIA